MKILSWNEILKSIDKLAEKIQFSGFLPDYLIGVTTGGLIPLALLSKNLNIENIITITATTSEKDGKKEWKITYMPEIDLKDKKVLLIDEIAETGTTLQKIKDAVVEKYKVKEIRIATIGVNKDYCKNFPDYYILEESGDWIIFPWEREEFPDYSTYWKNYK
ncbi:hypothetical protein HY029_03840 [Candidatus Gottesmanbacteria bacterium]|nr:hypothetical protein [Candidatus Gottesmanbacteria bacterium]